MAAAMVFVVAFTAHCGVEVYHLGEGNRNMRVVEAMEA